MATTAQMPAPVEAPEVVKAKQDIVRKTDAIMKRLTIFRRQYDTRRLIWYRNYLGSQDASMFPDGVTKRSNIFLKYPLSNVEQIVSRVLDAFFSFAPWFECSGEGANDAPAAEAMQLVEGQLLSQAKFEAAFEQMVRTICIYGHGGMKVDWDWDFDHVVRKDPVFLMIPVIDPQTGQPVIGPDGQPMSQPAPDPTDPTKHIILGWRPIVQDVPRMRPKFVPIDVYDLLVDPDGGIVAFMTERTVAQLEREAASFAQLHPEVETPLYYPEGIAKIKSAIAVKEVEDANNLVTVRIAEVWDEINNTCTILAYGKDTEVIGLKDARMALRNATSRASKRKAYGGESVLLWHGDNPFMHMRMPILHTGFIKVPGEVYGLGAIEIIADVIEGLNRSVNMIADNWNMGINRRYAYDTNADIDHEALKNFNTPGGLVGTSGDPSNIIKELPFFTPQAGDYDIIGIYKNNVESASGISDFYAKGVGAPTGNRTATGISNVINESNYRFKMFIRNLELDILQPVLKMVAANIQQFVTDTVEVMITDAQPAVPKYYQIKPSELIGSVNFTLVAANYASSKIVRQRNMLAFANLAMQSPFWNQYEGLKELSKVFEIRNAARLLKTPDQVAQEQAAAQAQQVKMMIFESMLNTESKARLSQAKPQTKAGKDGRPASMQFEGKIPGAGLEGPIMAMAQSMGANAFGLEGLGQAPEGD